MNTDSGQTDGGSMAMSQAVGRLMDEAWREPGFCVPNQTVYPHQWLWDSCFHAVVWAALGDDRGLTEIASALETQDPDGFVPHMTYWLEPEAAVGLWGRPKASTITQPPMYGHALAVVADSGHQVPGDLIERAAGGLLALGRRPATPAGLVPVLHPWETGCDDSARWDDFLPTGVDPLDDTSRRAAWRDRKAELVAELGLSTHGAAAASPGFTVGSVGFNALVAWNTAELVSAFGQRLEPTSVSQLTELRDRLTTAVAARWRGDRWVDDGPPSGAARTLDAMAALLVDPRAEAFDALVDPDAYGATYGPRGVHLDEPTYRPDIYWRGPAWPQLGYLMMVAADRAGHRCGRELADSLAAGAERSGFAEYWNPETGEGLGARPQTWAGLGLAAVRR